MKISSASKKVLASALSAAMVVAFAPTAAFAAKGDAATIIIDANGGNASVTNYTNVKQGDEIELGTATKAGYTFAGWWYDENKDGKVDETLIDPGKTTVPLESEVTYKAIWAAPACGTLTFVAPTKNKEEKMDNGSITVPLSKMDAASKVLKKDATYTLTLTNPNGTVVGTKEYKPAAKGATNEGYAYTDDTKVEFTFTQLTNSTVTTNADIDKLVGGTYTATLSDGSTVVSTETIKIVKLTQVANDAAGTKTVSWFTEKTDSALAGYVDAEGFTVANTKTLKAGDVTLYQVAAAADQTVEAGKYSDTERSLAYDVTLGTASSDDVTYTASLTDPSGKEIYSQKITGAKGAKVTVKVSFDQSSSLSRVTAGATETAGAYTLVVTKADATAASAVESKVKAKISLSEIKLDAGANGAFKSAVKDSAKDYFTSDVELAAAPDASKLVDPSAGYAFKEWQINGKAFDANKNNIKAGEVNTLTAVYKASDTVQAPTVASATYDSAKKEWTVKLACATTGAKIQVWDGAKYVDYIDADGYTFSKDAAAAKVKGVVVKGATESGVTKESAETDLSWDQTAFTEMVKGGKSALENYIGKSKVKYLDEASVKAAIAAGQSALDAQGVNVKADWDKLVKAQCKAVYEAVSAFAKAELAKYADEAPVVTGDKAYYVKAADLKDANDAVAKADKAASAKDADAATYKTQSAAIVAAVNTAIDTKAVESKLTAADIQAAAAVTAQLKAATTGAEAEAALKAFEALTDAQKALVSAADVAAAQKVADEAKAQAELIAAQDDAAVSKARNASKTVKLAKGKTKTTKKQSVALKAIVSKSGAVVTYKKASGKKAVTVKGNKAYLAKGTKKGTYKASVTATCGEQTAKITVTFKVK